MSVAVPPSLNGRPRKQLSDQLDRLDEVINGLEEFLPQAVADATRDGVRQAFRDVMAELVTDLAVLDKLRSVIAPENGSTVVKATAFSRLKARINAVATRLATSVAGGIAQTAAATRRLAQTVKQGYSATKKRLAYCLLLTMPLKSIVTVGLLFGIGVAAISYIAPHHIAALLSGLEASFSAMAMQTARWFRSRRHLLNALC